VRRGQSFARKLAAAFALTPIIALVFLLLVTASVLIPDGPIKNHISKDLDIVTRERIDNGRRVDALTECTGLSIGLRDDPAAQGRPLAVAAQAPTVVGCASLTALLSGAPPDEVRDYFRYWHGYSVISRPVLYFLPYNDLRQHLVTASLLVFGILLWRIGTDFSPTAALGFAVPFLVLNAFGYWIVVTKAVTWFLMIGGAIWASRRKRIDTPLLGFFILGALTAFFDFLTAPATIFALTALVHGLYAARRGEPTTIHEALSLLVFWRRLCRLVVGEIPYR
jgi:hypothetical protein